MVLHQALPPVVAHLPVPDHLAVPVLARVLVVQSLVVRNLVVRSPVTMPQCSVAPIAKSMIDLAM